METFIVKFNAFPLTLRKYTIIYVLILNMHLHYITLLPSPIPNCVSPKTIHIS